MSRVLVEKIGVDSLIRKWSGKVIEYLGLAEIFFIGVSSGKQYY